MGDTHGHRVLLHDHELIRLDQHGWMILDRCIPNNKHNRGDNVPLKLLRLQDLNLLEIPRSDQKKGDRYNPHNEKHLLPPEKISEIEALLPTIREWRRQHEIRKQQEDTSTLFQKQQEYISTLLCKTAANPKFVPPRIDKRDLELCLEWCKSYSSSVSSPDQLISGSLRKKEKFNASRLISARRAEKATEEFYTELGDGIDDVSICQLDKPTDENWKYFDFVVHVARDNSTAHDYCIDVKNARPTYDEERGKKKYFAQLAVAKFKETRDFKEEVRLTGIYSQYFPDPVDAAQSNAAEVTILGEISLCEIKKLTAWLSKRFEKVLKIDDIISSGNIPGWFFEYPERYYKTRPEALDQLLQLIRQKKHTSSLKPALQLLAEVYLKKELNACPDIIREAIHETSLPSKDIRIGKNIIKDFQDMIPACGLAKRCLILYIMGLVLETAKCGKDAALVIDQMKSFVNINQKTEIINPLGLQDPNHFFVHFISTFETIAPYLKASAKDINYFLLIAPDLLRAKMNDNRFLTMFTHCGGWRADNRGKCGHFLVSGVNQHCLECGWLKCFRCDEENGYCHCRRNSFFDFPNSYHAQDEN